MSTFTQENPFEFEGGKMWSNEQGDVVVDAGGMGSMSSPLVATRHHAFIEAENNVWHEDGKWFRKGRWFVDDSERPYVYVSHNDIPGEAWAFLSPTNWDRSTPNAVRAIGASFFAWHAENYPKQPAEPTGLGAVIEVAGKRWVIDIPGEACPWWRMGKREGWGQLIARGPVTVLSEGVTS